MASTYKVLGQSKPSADTNSDLYTNPENGQAIVSTVAIANTGDLADSYRIFIRKDGATASDSNALVHDAIIDSNSTVTMTLGATIDSQDVITVYSRRGNVTFHAFGLEIL